MAKWTLPEGKIYTQAELDAAVTAALREAADAVAPKKKEPKWRGHWLHGETDKGSQVAIQIRKQLSENILALIPDAGAALDRALADQRERDAKVAEARADEKDSYGPDFDAGWEAAALVIAAAIRAQGGDLP